MSHSSGRMARTLATLLLVTVFAIPAQLIAQEHVVSSADLQKQAVSTANTRQQNIETLQKAFSGSKAENALKAAKIDPAQVKNAVSSLSDADLAKLSARVNHAQQDFSAGDLNDRDLLLILVAVAVLILLIVAIR